MKKIATLALLIAMMVSSFNCKKDSSGSSVPAASLSMKLNGTSWNATTISAAFTSSTNTTTIVAIKSGTSDNLELSYIGTGKGTYTIDMGEASGSGTIGSVSFDTGNSLNATGSVIVTGYDSSNKLISGTFSFMNTVNGTIVYNVTAGTFENVPVAGH